MTKVKKVLTEKTDIDEFDDPDELAKHLEDELFPDEETKPEGEEETDEEAEEPEGEGDGESKNEDVPPEPEAKPEQEKERVPVDLYTDTRKAKDAAERRAEEAERQLEEANRQLEEARKATGQEGDKPLSEDDKEALRDELGEEAANRIIALEERQAKLVERLESAEQQAQAAADDAALRQSMKETPDLLKWYDGMSSSDKAIAEDSEARIKVAADFEGIAQRRFPDDRTKQNQFIERQVKEWFEDAPAPEKPPAKPSKGKDTSPSIGEMTGGQSDSESNSDEAFLARMETASPDKITSADQERLDRIIAEGMF